MSQPLGLRHHYVIYFSIIMFDLLLAAASASTQEVGLWEDLTKTFHIELPLFISQIINFIIVLVVLYFLALKPLTQVMTERRDRIIAGEEKLKQIEADLKASDKKAEKIIGKANDEAKRLITEAKASGDKLLESKTQDAITSAQSIIKKAEEAAIDERKKLSDEVRAEFAELVVKTTAKVTDKALNDSDKKKIRESAVSSI